MKNKKGLSDIVATLIIILLVIVAAGIIWGVVRNVVQQGADQIEAGQRCFSISLEIENAIKDGDDGNYSIRVWNKGTEIIEGIKIAISNNTANTQPTIISEFNNLAPAGRITSIISSNPKILNATKVEAIPFFMVGGKETLCVEQRAERII